MGEESFEDELAKRNAIIEQQVKKSIDNIMKKNRPTAPSVEDTVYQILSNEGVIRGSPQLQPQTQTATGNIEDVVYQVLMDQGLTEPRGAPQSSPLGGGLFGRMQPTQLGQGGPLGGPLGLLGSLLGGGLLGGGGILGNLLKEILSPPMPPQQRGGAYDRGQYQQFQQQGRSGIQRRPRY